MLSGHVVESLCFEVGFAAEGPAFAWQSRLERFAQRRMVEVVGEVFDELSAAGEVWRLERVEVDLGMVAEGDGEAVWVERLRDGLRRALGEQRRVSKAAGGGNGSGMPGHDGAALAHAVSQPRDEAELGWLLFFLAHGHLPWGTGAVDASALEAMALRVVAVSGAALVAALRVGDVGERMARRLAWQFDGRVCGAVMAVASGPSTRAGWGSLDRGSAAVWRELGLRAALAPTVAAVRDGEVSVGDVGLAGRQVWGSGSGVALDGAPASASSPARAGAARAANDRPLARHRRRGRSGSRRAGSAIGRLAPGEIDAAFAPAFDLSPSKDTLDPVRVDPGETLGLPAMDQSKPPGEADANRAPPFVLSPSASSGQAPSNDAPDGSRIASGRPAAFRAIDRLRLRERVSAQLRLALAPSLSRAREDSSAVLRQAQDERSGGSPNGSDALSTLSASTSPDRSSAVLPKDDAGRDGIDPGHALRLPRTDQRGAFDEVDATLAPPLVPSLPTNTPDASRIDPDKSINPDAVDPPRRLDEAGATPDHGASSALDRSGPCDEPNAAAQYPLMPPLSKATADQRRIDPGTTLGLRREDQPKTVDEAVSAFEPSIILSSSKDQFERSRADPRNTRGSRAIDRSSHLDEATASAMHPLIAGLSKDMLDRSRIDLGKASNPLATDQPRPLGEIGAADPPSLILSPAARPVLSLPKGSGQPLSKDQHELGRAQSSDAPDSSAIDRSSRPDEPSAAAPDPLILSLSKDSPDPDRSSSPPAKNHPSRLDATAATLAPPFILSLSKDQRERSRADSIDSSAMDRSNRLDEPNAAAPGALIPSLSKDTPHRSRGASSDPTAPRAIGRCQDAHAVLRQAQDERSPASPTSSDTRSAHGLPRQHDEGSAVLRQAQDERGWYNPDSGDALFATSLSSLPDGSNTVLRQAQDEPTPASPTSSDTRPAPGLPRQHDEGNVVLRQVQDERGRGGPDSGDALPTSGFSTQPDGSNAALRHAQDERGEWHSDSSNPPSPPTPSAPGLAHHSSPRHQALALRIRLLADACAAAHAPALRPHITALGALLLHRLPPSFDLHYATVQLLHDTLMSLLPPRPSAWCRALQQPLADGQAPAHREAAHSLAEALATLDHDFAAPPHRPGETTPTTNAPLYIANAGLVLAAPYLPRLWSMLDLAGPRAFVHPAAAHRAVHLTQYLVVGDNDHPTPEHYLVLNKLICGVPIAEPITAAIDITTAEREAIHGLLQSMIQHWKILGRTSVAGLRESFLQREGRLLCSDEAWNLQVQPRAFDMLLDQIPWGYATLRFPWMERLIHVDWR